MKLRRQHSLNLKRNMAQINSKILFLTTSPRSPEKMIPEIELLVSNFKGKAWNHPTQVAFMELLKEENFFHGEGENDPAFSARDRITRAPKSLGFLELKPTIQLTLAGEALLSSKFRDEVFLRQLLKFQLPSPYHKLGSDAAVFCIRPYLELLRLVRTLGTLKFIELQLFGMQLTDWHNFEEIVKKIEKFRVESVSNSGSYKQFISHYAINEAKAIYANEISKGKLKTRESNDETINKFLATKISNMRDYADACFRYLRITGLVNVSHIGKSLSIVPERITDVDYILRNIDRNPIDFENEKEYIKYLGDATTPNLLTDDKSLLIKKIRTEFPTEKFSETDSTSTLKELLATLREETLKLNIATQQKEIKDYKQYDDIQNIYEQIKTVKLYDAPLLLEWNTWRAMTMLDGGNITANLNFDNFGKPMSTAAGNMPDIVCDYGDFELSVEVTMSTGQRQYEMEGEPVARHLGRMKAQTGKQTFCLFVAPKISEATISHFYTLHNLNVKYYGGKSVIIPSPLEIFQKMLEDSYKATYTPDSKMVRKLFDFSQKLSKTCDDEAEWYAKITDAAKNWLIL